MTRGRAGLAGLCLTVALAASGEATVDRFLGLAETADIVVIGEVHDNPHHHRIQAEIVAALSPGALVFEMIPRAAEAEVNALRAAGAGADAIATALRWEASGWPDFGFYAPVLAAAPRARVFGAEQPAEDVRRAVSEGAAAVFGADAGRYGLDRPLAAEEQAAREALQADAHCGALPADLLPGMVEAQRFRDAGIADAALRALVATGGQVVVIAGTGHAHATRGAPAAIAAAAPEARVVTLGQFEGAPDDAGAYDAHLLAPAPDRGDPCAPLRAGNG